MVEDVDPEENENVASYCASDISILDDQCSIQEPAGPQCCCNKLDLFHDIACSELAISRWCLIA